jgi:hypothetical protein
VCTHTHVTRVCTYTRVHATQTKRGRSKGTAVCGQKQIAGGEKGERQRDSHRELFSCSTLHILKHTYLNTHTQTQIPALKGYLCLAIMFLREQIQASSSRVTHHVARFVIMWPQDVTEQG